MGVIIVLCNISHAKWWWGLMGPVFINAGWGLVCHFALPATPEAHARKEAAEKAALTGTTLNTEPEEPAKRGITIKEALQIPSVAGYCAAFGFMKTINYVLFFWLPLFLQTHFEPDTANMISTLYDFGMMPGVIVVFLLILCPLLMIMALFADTLNTFTLMVMLACMGILIGGPNNIVTSAVAADLAEHPSIRGSKSALGTVVGLINGSGSFVAAMGQMAVPLITDALGWSALWYFMLCSTVISCLLMIPKIKQELAGEEAAPAPP